MVRLLSIMAGRSSWQCGQIGSGACVIALPTDARRRYTCRV
jgi:hypothetical protein